jgi:hypothetical protein
MFGISDAHHFRKMVAGFCMVVAPIVALVGFVIHPETKSDEAAQIGVVAAHMDAWYLSHLLLFISVVLAVPAALGLMHMLRAREVALGHLGGGMALAGLMAISGILGMEMVAWQMGVGADGEMASLLNRVNETTGIVIPFFLGSLLFGLGYAALGLGLYKARAAGAWFAMCLVAGGVLFDVAFVTESLMLTIVGMAFIVVGQGAIGRMVWTESDDAWERTPEYTGFKALPGMR